VVKILGSVIFSMAFGSAAIAAEDLAESLTQTKTEIAKADEASRDVMGTLYEINQRMKTMSKKRDILNNRMLSVEGNVRVLSSSKEDLESKIAVQRRLLSKRLRAMYMLGDQPLVRTIFSSTSSQDLEKSVKYLRLIAVQDQKLIKSLEKNLATLKVRTKRLETEVAKLSDIKLRMRNQEKFLERDQKSKSSLLVNLREEKEESLKKLNGLRRKAAQQQLIELVDTSFFENKGRLAVPVAAPLVSGYGLTENAEFKYRLAHKGHSYDTSEGEPVRAVFGGKVSYVGQVAGYGATIILDHSDHFYTVYSNNESSEVSKGNLVNAGDTIAKSGSSFYFEIRHFSDAVDPSQWLASKERIQ
jgi:murein hydrolase activator